MGGGSKFRAEFAITALSGWPAWVMSLSGGFA